VGRKLIELPGYLFRGALPSSAYGARLHTTSTTSAPIAGVRLVHFISSRGAGFVPVYASEWIITYLDACPTSPPLILFSDNLSGQGKVRGKTDVILI